MSFSEIVDAIAAAAGAPRPFAIPAWLLRLAMPYMAGMVGLRAPLSSAKATHDLGWRPVFPTIHEGLAQTLHRAA